MDHSLKMVKVASYFLLVASCLTPAHGGTNCFQCSDIPSARDCDTVVECNPYEVCYSTQVVASSGHIYRRMGCRDKRQCSSGIVGKRSLVRDAGDLPVCDGCCNSTLCQPKLCQDLDFDAKRGPICFNCNDQLPEEKCTRIRECGRDEVCYMSHKASPSGQKLRQTGCYSKLICDRLSASLAGHATNETCWKCCSGDLCNAGCGVQSHTSAPGVITTRTPATSSNCVDKTPHTTCQLASSIVCRDTAHAQNAGCMHSCGFC